MDDILAKAKEYQDDVALRAKAHERSAEWHRWRGEVLGNATTIVSGIVGSAVFGTLLSQLGLSGKNRLTLPAEGWPLFIFVVVFFLSILAPVLSTVQTRMNDAGQAATHKASAADYHRLQQELDRFRLRYTEPNSSPGRREEALKELDNISVDIQGVSSRSLTLTDHAIAAAEKATGRRKSST